MSRPLARRKFAMFTTHKAIFNEIVWSKTCIQSQLYHNRTLHMAIYLCTVTCKLAQQCQLDPTSISGKNKWT